MCGKKEEDEGECSQSIHQSIQNYQEQLFLHHQLQQQQQQYGVGGVGGGGGRGGGGLLFPEISPILPWSFSPVHTFNPVQFSSTNSVREQQQQQHHHHDPFLVPPPPPPPSPPPPPLPPTSSSSYGGFFNRRAASALQFAYDHHHHNPSSSTDHHHHHLRIISDQILGSSHVHQPGSSSHPFGSLQAELGKMTAQEIMDAKALAASKSHSEAERRRRERINNHLAKLRSLLPSTTKTDKASLLAEVIQHVKELKRQTSQIAEASPVPTENDELTVDNASDEDGKFIIKASLCCEDRTDLLPDLIKTLKALRLRTLKAEITTLGGRVKNVLFITGDHHSHDHDKESSSSSSKINEQHSLTSIQEALKAVMERTTTSTPPSGDDQMNTDTATTTTSSGSIKRQRTNNNMNMLEQQQQQQQQQQQHRSL